MRVSYRVDQLAFLLLCPHHVSARCTAAQHQSHFIDESHGGEGACLSHTIRARWSRLLPPPALPPGVCWCLTLSLGSQAATAGVE